MKPGTTDDTRQLPQANQLRRALLTDPGVLPSATSIRFAVLVLMIVASASSIYGYLGLMTLPGADDNARRCLAQTSLAAVRAGNQSPTPVLACTEGYTGRITTWSLVGVVLVVLTSLAVFALTPWWMRRFNRPWIPLGRTRRWRLQWRRTWWMQGSAQRPRPLDPARTLERQVLHAIAELAGHVGLPGRRLECWLNPRAFDTGAQVFGHRRSYIMLNAGLVGVYLTDRPQFDATVLHELGHLRNRDTVPSHLAYAVWRVFVALVLLPYLTVLVLPDVVHPTRVRFVSPDLHVLAAVATLTALVYLSRSAVLRVRETHADATAALYDEGALRVALDRARTSRRRRYLPEILDHHPRPERREACLEDPARCQAPGFVETGLSGFQGCGDRLGHRVVGFVFGGWDVSEFAV